MEHELPKVLDGIDEPATVEELEAVVRRATQRRRARLIAGAAALLAVGGLGGALARETAGEQGARVAAGGGDSTVGLGTGSSSMAPLFRREANGVTIRVYRTSQDGPPRTATAGCETRTGLLHGGLSSSAAVGTAIVYTVAGDTLAVLGAATFGEAEGAPATWTMVRAGAGAAAVRLRAGTASDEMEPRDGHVALAVPGVAAEGAVVEALGPDGAVIASQPVDQRRNLVPMGTCDMTECEPFRNGTAAPGSVCTIEPPRIPPMMPPPDPGLPLPPTTAPGTSSTIKAP